MCVLNCKIHHTVGETAAAVMRIWHYQLPSASDETSNSGDPLQLDEANFSPNMALSYSCRKNKGTRGLRHTINVPLYQQTHHYRHTRHGWTPE